MSDVYTRWRGRLSTRRALLAVAERRVAFWRTVKKKARKGSKAYSHAGYMLARREHELKTRRDQVAYAERVVARHKPVPLRERAYKIAASQVGVMESGGNNQGTPYVRYQRSNDAVGPEPWCGDFMAWVYRQAGSKAVQRLWASVYYLGRISGLYRVKSPKRGDLVRFKFDHVGMFVRWVAPGVMETIEGNTGASGAVSDSKTGGDGVYRKHRTTDQVADYRRVSR